MPEMPKPPENIRQAKRIWLDGSRGGDLDAATVFAGDCAARYTGRAVLDLPLRHDNIKFRIMGLVANSQMPLWKYPRRSGELQKRIRCYHSLPI